MGQLRQLRQIADSRAASFRSDGFTALFGTLAAELSDDYFEAVNGHLAQLRFRGGVLLGAGLGPGHKAAGYVLRRPGPRKRSFLRRISGSDRNSYTLRIPDRDESGHRSLADLRGRGINLAANALAQSTDHILGFFTMLRCELGFYVAA